MTQRGELYLRHVTQPKYPSGDIIKSLFLSLYLKQPQKETLKLSIIVETYTSPNQFIIKRMGRPVY